MNQHESNFIQFTWEQLELWAGIKCVERGRGYLDRVHALCYSPQDELFSTVVGTETYYTHVWLDAAGELVSECTCPVGSRCKHAVASILVFVQNIQEGTPTPLLSPDDPRPAKIASVIAEKSASEMRVKPPPKRGSVPDASEASDEEPDRPKRTCATSRDRVQEYIHSLGFRAREQLLLDIVSDHPAVYEDLLFRLDQQRTNDWYLRDVGQKLRAELLSKSISWSVRTRASRHLYEVFSQLIHRGQYEWILEDGTSFLHETDKAMDALLGEDDIEVEIEFEKLLVPIFDLIPYALEKTPRTRIEKILWDTKFHLQISGWILHVDSLWEEPEKTTPEEWSAVADALGELLPHYGGNDRERILRYRECALKRAGRREPVIIALLESLETGRNYVDLVRELNNVHRVKEAEEWCRHALFHLPKADYYRSDLRDELEKMAAAKDDFVTLAVVATERFLETCEERLLEPMIGACERADVWNEVRPELLDYLETGKLPNAQKSVLPRTGPIHIKIPSRERPYHKFPFFNLLIQISLYDKRPCESLHFYQKAITQGHSFLISTLPHKIIQLILNEFPVEAFHIWEKELWNHPNLSAPNRDDSAKKYLPRIRQILVQQGRIDTWKNLVQHLQTTYPKDFFISYFLQRMNEREHHLQKKITEE